MINRKLFPAMLACMVGMLPACRTGPDGTMGPGTVVADPMVVAPPAPLAVPPLAAAEWPSAWSNSWVALQEFGRYLGFEGPVALAASNQPPSFALRRHNNHLAITIGNRWVEYDGLICFLGFPPKLVRGVPYIHGLDILKNLYPLITPNKATLPANPIVVIDAGHGGRDPGTISPWDQRSEKDYTLDWAQRAGRLFAAKGWRVFLTRTNDADINLAERVLKAEQVNADLFVSLHFNSGGANRERKGIETYCLTPAGMASTLVRSEQDDPHVAWANNAFDEQNIEWAVRLHRSLVEKTRAADGGVRRARFMTVLRTQRRPAVLIEGGYLSNLEEARLIGSPAYRQKLAEALVAAFN